jgi:predicted nucleotidyltransferase
MLKLTLDEQAWLDAYRQALAEQFQGLVEEIAIFGSKARGDAGPDSDLDVLVILRKGDRNTKRAVRRTGHQLAVLSDAVPSIMVYTREEWSSRQRSGSLFYQAIMRDGVRVA